MKYVGNVRKVETAEGGSVEALNVVQVEETAKVQVAEGVEVFENIAAVLKAADGLPVYVDGEQYFAPATQSGEELALMELREMGFPSLAEAVVHLFKLGEEAKDA